MVNPILGSLLWLSTLVITNDSLSQTHIGSWRTQSLHDVGVENVLHPIGRVAISLPTELRVRIWNNGTSSENNVPAYVEVRDRRGFVYYRDSLRVPTLQPGRSLDTSFTPITPGIGGWNFVTAWTNLGDDANRLNDTLISTYFVGLRLDVRAISVTDPPDGSVRLQKVVFQPEGVFTAGLWDNDVPAVRAEVEIDRCSDSAIVFLADSTIPALPGDSSLVRFQFPSRWRTFDIRKLVPGCYKAIVRASTPLDVNYADDSAYSFFTIAPNRLANDVVVDSFLSPSDLRVQPHMAAPIRVRLHNAGTQNQTGFPVRVTVLDFKRRIVFADTVQLPGLVVGEMRNVTFRSFTPLAYGTYTVVVACDPVPQDFAEDDTLSTTLAVGYSEDVAVLGIVSPLSGAWVSGDSSFSVVADVEWRGSEREMGVQLNVEIHRCADSSLVATFSDWRYLSLDSGRMRIPIAAQFWNGYPQTGCYYAKLYPTLIQDTHPADDTAYTTFTLVPQHDVRIEHILSPVVNSSDSNLVVSVRAFNNGAAFERASVVHLSLSSEDSTDGSLTLLKEDSVTVMDWASRETRDVTFPTFTLPDPGFYLLTLTLNDIATAESTAMQFFYGSHPNSVQAMRVISPRHRRSYSVLTSLQAAYQWPQGYPDTSAIPVSLIIRRCDDKSIVYRADTLIAAFLSYGTEENADFPLQSGNYDVLNLRAGCYLASAIAGYPRDEYRSDDTATSQFEILAESVAGSSAPRLSMTCESPIAGGSLGLRYECGEAGRVTVTLIDAMGRIVRTEELGRGTEGEHIAKLSVRDLPAGFYVVRLIQETPGGRAGVSEKIILP